MGTSPSKPPSVVFCIPKDEVTHHLEQNVRDLEGNMDSALQKLTALAAKLQTNRTQCIALAREFVVGVLAIKELVRVTLQLLTEVDSGQLCSKALVVSVAILIVSLEEIGRWGSDFDAQCSRLEVPGPGVDPTLSKSWVFALFRNISFCRTLLEVGFYRFLRELTVLGVLETPNGWNISNDVAVEFCNREPLDLFEWCVRSCRPVLKQCHLELGEQLMQLPHPGMDYLGLTLTDARAELARCSLWTQVLETPSAEPSDSLPLRVDSEDVKFLKPLGQGGFGAVFQCKWRDQDIAMKRIPLDVASSKHLEKFQMEVKILSSFHHPNIVRTFGYGLDTQGYGCGFILMEQMEMALDQLIRVSRRDGGSPVFDLEVSMDLMSQIVEGMCALRDERVIHRDLKPGNILINRLDHGIGPSERIYQVKVADFGTSKQLGVETSKVTTRKVGTPPYMAPEIISAVTGKEGYSWEADVYSFGMVCSEILTGEHPFKNLDIVNCDRVLAALRRGERPNLPLDREDPLRKLIEDCWKLQPKERPDVWEIRRRLSQCRLRRFSRSLGNRMNILFAIGVDDPAALFRDLKVVGRA